MSTSFTSTNKRIDSLQGLRTVAFLLVFLLHSGLADTGEIGVSIFFVLSGFVMTLSYMDKELDTSIKGLFKFSIGRIKKLYPLHIITMLAFLYFEVKNIIENFNIGNVIKTIWHVFLSGTLMQAWAPMQSTHSALNGISWYFSVCLFIYLLFPLVNKGIKNYKSTKKAYFTIFITAMVMLISAMIAAKIDVPETISNNFIRWFTYIFPLFRFGDFFIGCNLAYIFKESNPLENKVAASFLELTAWAFLALIWYLRLKGVFIFGNYFMRLNLDYLPTSIAIVYLTAMNKGIISRLFSIKPMVAIGNLTGQAYFIHYPVIIYFYLFLNGRRILQNSLLSNIAILVITFILAFLYAKLTSRSRKEI